MTTGGRAASDGASHPEPAADVRALLRRRPALRRREDQGLSAASSAPLDPQTQAFVDELCFVLRDLLLVLLRAPIRRTGATLGESQPATATGPPSTPARPLLLSIRETARLLSISQASVFGLCRQRRLPSVRLGRRLLVPRAALERFITEQSEAAMAALTEDALDRPVFPPLR